MTQLPERVPHQQWNRADVGSVSSIWTANACRNESGVMGLEIWLRGSTPPAGFLNRCSVMGMHLFDFAHFEQQIYEQLVTDFVAGKVS